MDNINSFLSKDKSKKSMSPLKTIRKKAKGKIDSIVRGKWLIIDHEGNGVRIPYDEKLHSKLKVGDEIEVP